MSAFAASKGMRFEYALRFHFQTSNNEVKYKVLIAGLHMAKGLRASYIQIFSDSQLIVNKITNEYQAKDIRMEKYLSKTKALLVHFQDYQIRQIPRSENFNAYALAKLASTYEADLARLVLVEILNTPTILEPDVMTLTSLIQIGWILSRNSYKEIFW